MNQNIKLKNNIEVDMIEWLELCSKSYKISIACENCSCMARRFIKHFNEIKNNETRKSVEFQFKS